MRQVELAQAISGFVVGLLVGLTGVGGGALMTPILIFFFGIPPLVAVGTDLLFAAITKSGGIIAHTTQRTINWRIAGLMMLGSFPTALLVVAWLGEYRAAGGEVNQLVKVLLGVALLLTALVLLFRGHIVTFARRQLGKSPWLSRLRLPLTLLAGVVIGTLVPLTSVGAGVLATAALLLLYPSLPARMVVGTDLVHAVPLTAIAGLGHLQLGSVDGYLLLTLLVGSLPGIFLGSRLSQVIPEKILRQLLTSLLLLTGLKCIQVF